MHLQVNELEEFLAKRDEDSLTAPLSEFTVTDDATMLLHENGTKTSFPLDETASSALTKYLKIPKAYYDKLTPDFRATVLRYEFARKKDVVSVLETLNKEVIAVHQVHQVMLPLKKVAGVIEKVFEPTDTIRRIIPGGERFHVDVTTANHSIMFNDEKAVGDITEAGVRFLSYPFRDLAPSTSLYAERLVCMNGMTTPEKLGSISLKGRTVDEVISEMEVAANIVLADLDDYLTQLAATRQIYPPGSPQAFVQQLAREANLKREIVDKVLDIVNQIPAPVSVWDIQNAFTEVAGQAQQYSNMTRLQNIGGALSFDTEAMIQRCGVCEQRL